MADARTSRQSILLLGRSLFMAAIEAGLRGEPTLSVRRMDDWSPHLTDESVRPDAVIVESLAAHAEAVAALVGAAPELLVIELAPGNLASRQAIVRFGERRSVESAHDLVQLIVGRGQPGATGAAQ